MHRFIFFIWLCIFTDHGYSSPEGFGFADSYDKLQFQITHHVLFLNAREMGSLPLLNLCVEGIFHFVLAHKRRQLSIYFLWG